MSVSKDLSLGIFILLQGSCTIPVHVTRTIRRCLSRALILSGQWQDGLSRFSRYLWTWMALEFGDSPWDGVSRWLTLLITTGSLLRMPNGASSPPIPSARRLFAIP